LFENLQLNWAVRSPIYSSKTSIVTIHKETQELVEFKSPDPEEVKNSKAKTPKTPVQEAPLSASPSSLLRKDQEKIKKAKAKYSENTSHCPRTLVVEPRGFEPRTSGDIPRNSPFFWWFDGIHSTITLFGK